MFKHTGIRRTANHNLRLATLLCLTAGFVNAAGFLGFSVLTTNVTGHAALFSETVALSNWSTAWVIGMWMLLFFCGAFISSLIIDIVGKNQRFSYLIPVVLEILILSIVASTANSYEENIPVSQIYSGSLLFAMGMQNALVSVISGSVVRTTHLTGTFTDLGIEVAELLAVNQAKKPALRSRVLLRVVIIFFFITGAIIGAYAFQLVRFHSFFIPALILVIALGYDVLRINARLYYRKISNSVRKVREKSADPIKNKNMIG